MKIKIAVLSLGLACSAFALDEYLPLGKGVLELDAGISHTAPEVGDAFQSIPLQAKYGIMTGLDLELGLNYGVNGATGLGQPEIAAKYAIGDMGLAAYVNVILPFATGDFDNDPKISVAPGLVYGKNFDKIQAVALVSYQFNTADGADDNYRIFLKPGYMVNDMLAGYVGLDYNAAGDANQTKLVPGVTYTASSSLAFEVNVPIVVAESSAGKYWGIWASLYYTIPSM